MKHLKMFFFFFFFFLGGGFSVCLWKHGLYASIKSTSTPSWGVLYIPFLIMCQNQQGFPSVLVSKADDNALSPNVSIGKRSLTSPPLPGANQVCTCMLFHSHKKLQIKNWPVFPLSDLTRQAFCSTHQTYSLCQTHTHCTAVRGKLGLTSQGC